MTRGQLNAGHLGGRFLKRAIPQKVKPVPASISPSDAVVESMQALPDANRRAGTSAAFIGLALSVGAHGLLMPHQGDSAVAAEPVASESTATVASAYDMAALSSDVDAVSPVVGSMREHVVQEGQTLWQIAEVYGVDAASLAMLNNMPLDAVLQVGQSLKVPVDNRIALSNQGQEVSDITAGYYGPVTGTSAAAPSSQTSINPELQQQQEKALEALRQKRDALRVSLNQLKALKPSHQNNLVAPVEPATVESTETSTLKPVVQSATVYRVALGDTLSSIAQAHGLSMEQLARANRLSDPNFLLVNQVLKIPKSTLKTAGSSPNLVAAKLPEAPASTPDTVVAPVISPIASGQNQMTAESPVVLNSALPQKSSTEASAPLVPGALPTSKAVPQQPMSVATAPFASNSVVPSNAATPTQRINYVENLRLEIVKLREKYSAPTAKAKVASDEATKLAAASLNFVSTPSAPTSTGRVNPEFSPTRYADTVKSQIRRLQPQSADSVQRSLTKQKPQLVASAPLGSQNYEPLVPSSLGQMVSPEVPPLGSMDKYLPRMPGRFAGYMWPTRGMLTSGFGWRWGRMHKGIDIAAPVGTPIVAAAPGVVITAGWNSGGYGYLVEIQHADGSVTLYAHNNRILVREGQSVDQGQQIAEMGSTGYSTGPHCHFEVHLPGQGAVNPIAYLPRSGA